MHKRRIYKAHPDCRWRTLRSRARLSRYMIGARPGCTTPQIRWTCMHPAVKRDTSPCIFGLSKIPDFERGLPPYPASRRRPCPFYSPPASSYPSALRIPGVRTFTSLSTCHAWHTRRKSAARFIAYAGFVLFVDHLCLSYQAEFPGLLPVSLPRIKLGWSQTVTCHVALM